MFEFFSISNIMFYIPLGTNGYDLSYIEAISAILGLICIYLASVEKTINYLFGIFSVILSAVMLIQLNLYANFLLQLFFFMANIYGWYAWTRVNEIKNEPLLFVGWLSMKNLMLVSVISLFSIILLTLYIDDFFAVLTSIAVNFLNLFGMNINNIVLDPDPQPFLDSSLLVLSVVAQILMSKKYIENWILWAVINVISITLYTLEAKYVFALQYMIVFFISVNGIFKWKKSMQNKSFK